MTPHKTIAVNASVKYDIVLGNGIAKEIAPLLKNVLGSCRLAILTDDKVDGLYGKKIETLLNEGGYDTVKFVIANGEESKNSTNLMEFINFMAEHKLTRKDAVIALGGGVVGDMAGFAAAVYLRGIKFVQIPTTLLAAVDSSVGGKTAIDIAAGKNLMGAFHQPSLVCCDTDMLKSLDTNVMRDGYAEVIKYGVIADRELFDKLKAQTEDINLVVARCVEIKRDIVEADEFDTGQRQLLNFGHTIGHAIELLSDFTITHGSAVAKGMLIAARIGAVLGMEDCSAAIKEVLERYGFDLSCPYSAEEIYEVALSDKKRSGGQITLVIPERIGKCILHKTACENLLKLLKEIEL